MARICAWQLVELGTDAHVSPDQRPTILDALLIECISLQYFLAALRLVIVTFVYHICRSASSSSPGSHSVVLSGLSPLCRSLLEPTCQRPAVSCVSTLPIFPTSDHAQVEHTASKTISIVPALLSKTVSSSFSDTQPLVDVDTSSRCAKTIAWQKQFFQFYVLCHDGGCRSNFFLFLHHLWRCRLSAFPVLSWRIFCSVCLGQPHIYRR